MTEMTFPTSQLYIDGAFRDAEGRATYGNIAPATGRKVGEAADGTAQAMDDAIAAARRAFDTTDWSTNVGKRLDHLDRFRHALLDLADDYRARISAETGATIGVTRGPGLNLPINFMEWTLDLARRYEWQRDIGVATAMGHPTRRLVIKEAAGVVGAITPWNMPVQINLAKVTAALAAGCTVVLKPAPETPWSAILLAEAAHRAGLPAGVLNVVTGADKAGLGEQLVADPRVDIISFTGSTATGRRIMAAAAPTLKRVFLELGGKSANIVLDDAPFPDALYSSLAVCYHAGQGCSLPTRILLPRSRYDEAVATIAAMYDQMPYGDPASEEQILGPVASRAQYDRVLGYIDLGKQEGARIVAGGGTAEIEGGYYIRPTVFADVRNDMRIAQEEIFGPVLVAIPYDDDDDAVRIANESIYGLGGAVQSADPERALNVARRIRTGTVNINAANVFAPDSPFGGYKQSGIGREMGVEGFEEYLQTKTIGVDA
ncbi:aldehyde dehydrogenase (NAD+) [Sphingomonas laterariae]|uniref:Aldehyde dehydrogenase (NAD+) n=1 Tax=Edaphosphingomonas laterariae TaxID=861865 RepID=A0A239BD07_9SPHN|nr:aldehyde dehydrogenase family protein [Sphingomonas laterariae]SNS05298.1 aldehyde dehydrogenase (NAD+) [Sphingomonas laterariae]